MSTYTTVNVPIFEVGNTPEELAEKLFIRSQEAGKEYKIINIYVENGKHIAWFYETRQVGAVKI